MKYLCIVHVPAGAGAVAQSPSLACFETLARGDNLLAQALQPSDQGLVVRCRNSRLLVADAAPTPIGEEIGGVVLLEAASLDDAAGMAAGLPLAKLGTIEVRPVRP